MADDNGVLSGDIAERFSEWQSQQQPDGSAADAGDFYARLADDAVEYRDSLSRTTDPFERAVQNFKEGLGEVSNIHQARDVTFSVEAARADIDAAGGGEAFDPTAFASDLGINVEGLEQLQIRDAATAREVAIGLARSTAADVDDSEITDLASQWRSNPETAPMIDVFRQRVSQEVGSWNSEKYGRDGERNSAQEAEIFKLVTHALKQSVGLARHGLRECEIEQLLRRARYACDSDFKPSQKQRASDGQPKQNNATIGYRNIHEAYQNSPR